MNTHIIPSSKAQGRRVYLEINMGVMEVLITIFGELVSAFAGYNGTGNRQCIGVFPNLQPTIRVVHCTLMRTISTLSCFDERHKDVEDILCLPSGVCKL